MWKNNAIWMVLPLIMLMACRQNNAADGFWPATSNIPLLLRAADTTSLEYALIRAGLVDVRTLDSTIRVDLRYGSTRNFMEMDFYEGFNRCYLQPQVAQMLVQAQQTLKAQHPDDALLVWDAARPQSVQQKMWHAVKPPPGMIKGFFVSNPAWGSLHNYGCAVDVTIIRKDGSLLDMGTDFDHFGPEAYPVEEVRMLRLGKISEAHIRNRRLLRSVMYSAGFWNIQTEWWHFNAMRREEANKRYEMIR